MWYKPGQPFCPRYPPSTVTATCIHFGHPRSESTAFRPAATRLRPPYPLALACAVTLDRALRHERLDQTTQGPFLYRHNSRSCDALPTDRRLIDQLLLTLHAKPLELATSDMERNIQPTPKPYAGYQKPVLPDSTR
jgi:hypothetical protein